MEHYVTLFDSVFLPQGIALYLSLERHGGKYLLWILCMDDEVHDALTRLCLPNVKLLKLSDLETPELLAIKSTRSKGEYCWTLTPFTPRFVFECSPEVTRVTYLDADMWFRKNPSSIFNELDSSGKSVLITDHAYDAEHDMSATSGQYCVQFMTFYRDKGEVVRKWWEQRCIEWCYNRHEDGKFGDQKYLDDWKDRFSEYVHVLKDKELLLAPWNATRYPYGNSVCWHFHALRVIIKSQHSIFIEYGEYRLPDCTSKYIYAPYVIDLRHAISLIKKYGIKLASQKQYSIVRLLKSRLKLIISGFYIKVTLGSYIQ